MTPRQQLSELDDLTAALRDGTDEMGRRLRAVQAYLDATGGGGARKPLGSDRARASGRAITSPVGGPAA